MSKLTVQEFAQTSALAHLLEELVRGDFDRNLNVESLEPAELLLALRMAREERDEAMKQLRDLWDIFAEYDLEVHVLDSAAEFDSRGEVNENGFKPTTEWTRVYVILHLVKELLGLNES